MFRYCLFRLFLSPKSLVLIYCTTNTIANKIVKPVISIIAEFWFNEVLRRIHSMWNIYQSLDVTTHKYKLVYKQEDERRNISFVYIFVVIKGKFRRRR